METMRYQENKKSYKGVIFGFFAFVIIGSGLIYLAISQEKEPEVIGKSKSDVQGLIDVSSSNQDKTSTEITYDVEDNVITDSKNSKLKGNITLPRVYVNGEILNEINTKIEYEYTSRFESLKEQMESAENSFTYTVTYNKYDNMVEGRKILSLTIYQRIIDDATKKTTTDKVESYNIDLATNELVDESEVMLDLFGKDYKTTVNDSIKSYVVNKGYKSESEFAYTVTGLENYYIKDSKLHILFNEDELVDKKYGVLDITIE